MVTSLLPGGEHRPAMKTINVKLIVLVLWIFHDYQIWLNESCHFLSLCCLDPPLSLYHVLFTVLSPMGHWLRLGALLEVTTWKQAPLSLLPTPSTLLPWSHNPYCDKQVPVRGLNFDLLKNTGDRKQGRGAPEIADVGRMDTLSAGLWEALEGLKHALSCQGRLAWCCLQNSSHFKSQLLQTVLYD